MSEIDAVLRAVVRSCALGLCEYCRISERFTLAEHEIDHVMQSNTEAKPPIAILLYPAPFATASRAATSRPWIPSPDTLRRYFIRGPITGMNTIGFRAERSLL